SVPGQRFDSNVISGWGNRTRTTAMSVGLQQELRPGWSASVGYFRTSYVNIAAITNTAGSASDFTSYCVTAATDSRLPGGGGYQVCGNVDVNPAKFGQVSNLVQLANAFGDVTRVFNGVDIATNGRFGHGAVIGGGVSIGRTVLDDCALNGTPQ